MESATRTESWVPAWGILVSYLVASFNRLAHRFRSARGARYAAHPKMQTQHKFGCQTLSVSPEPAKPNPIRELASASSYKGGQAGLSRWALTAHTTPVGS